VKNTRLKTVEDCREETDILSYPRSLWIAKKLAVMRVKMQLEREIRRLFASF